MSDWIITSRWIIFRVHFVFEIEGNCRELLEFGKDEDFLYIIDPTKSGPSRTYCDQSTNGGSWNVIQRRLTGEETFDRDWEDYKGRFGYLNREMWLGNELIHNITATTPHQLLVEATVDGTSLEIDSIYRTFSISNEDRKYSLSVSGFISGNWTVSRISKKNEHAECIMGSQSNSFKAEMQPVNSMYPHWVHWLHLCSEAVRLRSHNACCMFIFWNGNCEAKSEAKSPRPLRGLQVDSSLTRIVSYAVCR